MPSPSSQPKFTLAVVQMAMSPDPADNMARAVAHIEAAAAKGAKLVLLPELFRSQYFCQAEDHAFFGLAEPVPGPSTDSLAALAKKLGVVIVASLFERRAAGLYHNTCALLDADGSLAGLYRKMHIPDDPAYYEKFFFTPGDLGFKAIDTKVARIGPLVCWDQWYPEGARLAALRGALLLTYPTAIGWHPAERAEEGKQQHDAWRTVQRGHAIANGVYVAVANRIGHEAPSGGAGIDFWGQSFVCDPQGIMLAEASSDKEEILYVEIDPMRAEKVRQHWPFLRDRRIDAYQGIEQRFIDDEAR